MVGSRTGKESFRMHSSTSDLIYKFGQHLPTRCYNISPEHVLSPPKTRNRIKTYPLLAGFHRWIWVNERTYSLDSHNDAENGKPDSWYRNNGTYAVFDNIILCCLQLGLQWVNFLRIATKHQIGLWCKKMIPRTYSLTSLQLTLSSFVVSSVVSSFCWASSSRMRLEQLCFNQVSYSHIK